MKNNVATKKISTSKNKPTREEAKQAVKTMLAWAGDNPDREGLIETPERVVSAYEEFFAGYNMNPDHILSKTFEEVAGYDEMVIIKDVRLESHCEHHMVPILGNAHVAYIPSNKVVTAQIADTIQRVLEPKGVAVVIDAAHQCMTTRGVHKSETSTVTSRMLGIFRTDERTRSEFMNLISSSKI